MMGNNQNLFFSPEEKGRAFSDVLKEVQEYISSKYSTLMVEGGNDEVKQRGDKQQHDDLGEDERKHARKLCSCFKARLCFVYAQNKRLKKLALVKRHRRDEKIGYDKTPYKRA